MREKGHGVTTKLLALLPVFALAACGFSPMYADRPGISDPATALAQVEVEQPENRMEQLVRNELLRTVPPAQQGGGVYRLSLDVTSSETTLLSATGLTRQRLAASFTLTNKSSGAVLLQGKSFADASYHDVGRQFSDARSKEAAQRAAARELAEDIRTRLAAWFARRQSTPR